MKLKKIITIALSAVMCLNLVACSQEKNPSTNSTVEKNAEKVITLAESWDFSSGIAPSLNPSVSPNYGAVYWGRNFYDTLVSYNKNGEIVGQLAENWKISDDGLTYTFSRRRNVKFSDGSDFTADSVKVSFEAAVYNLGDYNGSYGRLSALFDSIEVIDDNTVAIHLTEPYYNTLNDLTMSCPLAIINPAAFMDSEDLTYGQAFQTTSFGTGPYMYEGDFENNTYTFVRNPYYWGEPPEVDVFKVKVIEDNDAKLLALRNGELDAILGSSRVSFDGYSELSSDSSFGTGMNEHASLTRYLGMNVTTAPFDDARVRQAVAYAIDQPALESSIFNGLETAAETLFPETAPYCDVKLTTYSTNLDKAQKLLEESGWVDTNGDGIREKDGISLEVDLNYMTSLASIDNAALAISGQLAKIGIKVNVIAGDMMTYYAAMATSPLLLANTYGGAFDPGTVVTNMNPAVSTDPLSMQYNGFFQSGVLDELDSTADTNRVQEIYKHILTTIADQSLLVPLTRSHELGIWNSDIIGGYDFYIDPSYTVISEIHMK
jgi:nickel transport system substrate-binding protein